MSSPATAQERDDQPSIGATSRISTIDALALGLVGLFAFGYGMLFGWLSLRRYWGYQMHALDMGNMGQAAWNTIHGHPFFFTNIRLPWQLEAWGTTTRLSFHVEPIFPLLSLSYLIHPGPESLIVLQTAALALGAVPTYLLARDVLSSALAGVIFSLVYLLFPTLEAMNLYEFHPVALATPLLIAAFLFAYRRQYLPFAVCCLLAMATKEEIGLTVALFGLYIAKVQSERRIGLLTAVAGILWSLFAVFVIEHHYRQPGTLTYLHTRYGYLEGSGHGIGGVIHTILHDPRAIASHLLIWPKADYVRYLLIPAGLLALLAPEILLLGAPTFVLNLLSSDFHMYSGVGDNSAELISVVVVASIVGAARARQLLGRAVPARRATVAVALYVLLAALVTQNAFGYTPIGPNYAVVSIGPHQRLADRFVSMVPPGAPVSTQDQLDPHLSSRHYLYLFADTGRQPPLVPANDVVLDISAPEYAQPLPDIHAKAMELLHQGWGVVAARDGLIYLRRGAGNKRIPASFYGFMRADQARPQQPLGGQINEMQLVGYDVARTDQPNHRIPNLEYNIYLRSHSSHPGNYIPVIFEIQAGREIGCSMSASLYWLPTTKWIGGHTYRVAMQPLETQSNDPGMAELQLSIQPGLTRPSCGTAWQHRGALTSVGTQTLSW
ncbi:MAG TPA: hypothetical protein DEV93_06935 [Chloroflexi bacterium]|jgi:uncharacterized membrane protein|nr:hypothetical protein [Chloroflexota bacterium]